MAEALPKAYEPAQVEAHWAGIWRRGQVFTPSPDASGEPFCIVIPPPNVTGALHIGHGLNLSLIDCLCRHARQVGKNVLWIPGTDHAGISTQNVVERSLAREGKSREELGREAFVEKVWQWREEYGHRILEQIEALGCSVDWTRLRFTMDDGLSRAVRKVFVQLYQEGLIYRGDYIINWCPRCRTALADDEVEHQEEAGNLWKVRYRLADGDGFLTIATTRPETIPGDTAICVHPEDERYAHLVGKNAIVPVIGREVPIIADSYVDREFGTGCLKVTPCHDPNDWLLGKKHRLEFIQVIDAEGVMKEGAGIYAGRSMTDCRAAIIEDIEKIGQLEGVEPLRHSVGRCYRCNTVVEPLVSRQWFVAATKMATAARAAVPEETQLLPESWLKTYYHWLDNIRDWCISRQIWWGHRIPAWTCAQCGELTVAEEAPERCPLCGSTCLIQEEDVLDTWFSSAIWPFTTLGWPDSTPELKRWYPTTALVTGFDILFFWVARMMMMGIHFLGEPPFKVIYLHALVRDAQGMKMSKSKGNGIDPLEMVQKYGCDALRYTLVSMAAMGRDIRMSEEKIESSRHFINKLWNAGRFTLLNLGEEAPQPVDQGQLEELYQVWILDRLEGAKLDFDQALKDYRFNDAALCVYKLLWDDFCDWFLELAKRDLQSTDETARHKARYVLWLAFSEILLLAYPIIPFVTAEMWSRLPGREETDIALVPYPPARPQCSRPEKSAEMRFLMAVIIAGRTLRSELGLNPSRKISLVIIPAGKAQLELLKANSSYFHALMRLSSLEISMEAKAPHASAIQVVEGCQVIVPLAGAVDLADEIARLDKELARIDKELVDCQKKLHNESFRERAPAEVVERERNREKNLVEARAKLAEKRGMFAQARESENGALPEENTLAGE